MISIRQVSKSFGSQRVLDCVSLDIPDQQITAIVGPSGVGKSVLLKLIMGIIPADGGEISIFGEIITAAKSEAERNRIRKNLGVLFQAAALFDSLTVYENIAFPLQNCTDCTTREVHKRVVRIMQALSLTRHAASLPQEIPIGMRKRVGLARALITEPRVILFDEPNTGLDPLVGQEVYDLIKLSQKKWGFTGIVISHELPEVFQVADKVVMLLEGKIIEESSPEQFARSDNLAVQQFLHGKKDGPIELH
jgi:phospholipid/cholesterol/gamma-HCH transport system ATP-binding protein